MCILLRYYKKVAVVKEKQKRSADENSIEDVDDEEFEKMIGNLFLLAQFIKLLLLIKCRTLVNLVFRNH